MPAIKQFGHKGVIRFAFKGRIEIGREVESAQDSKRDAGVQGKGAYLSASRTLLLSVQIFSLWRRHQTRPLSQMGLCSPPACVCMCMCACACACVCVWGGGGESSQKATAQARARQTRHTVNAHTHVKTHEIADGKGAQQGVVAFHGADSGPGLIPELEAHGAGRNADNKLQLALHGRWCSKHSAYGIRIMSRSSEAQAGIAVSTCRAHCRSAHLHHCKGIAFVEPLLGMHTCSGARDHQRHHRHGVLRVCE